MHPEAQKICGVQGCPQWKILAKYQRWDKNKRAVCSLYEKDTGSAPWIVIDLGEDK